MRVVNNCRGNHIEEVKDLLANSNKALIASPFISLTVIDKMKNWLTFGFQELTLITTLKEKDPDQLRKVPVLLELFRLKKTRGFHLTVKIDNQLHGKVYIGKRDSNYTGAIVTSANPFQKLLFMVKPNNKLLFQKEEDLPALKRVISLSLIQ